jgi:hypothetical protein
MRAQYTVVSHLWHRRLLSSSHVLFSHTLSGASDRWVQVAEYMSAELGYLVRACRVRSRVQKLKARPSGNNFSLRLRCPAGPRELQCQHTSSSSSASRPAHLHRSPSHLPLGQNLRSAAREEERLGQMGLRRFDRSPDAPVRAGAAAAAEWGATSLSRRLARGGVAQTSRHSSGSAALDGAATGHGRIPVSHIITNKPVVRLRLLIQAPSDRLALWSREQDEKLIHFVETDNTRGWVGIAALLGKDYTAEACFSRYWNCLSKSMMPPCAEVPWTIDIL